MTDGRGPSPDRRTLGTSSASVATIARPKPSAPPLSPRRRPRAAAAGPSTRSGCSGGVPVASDLV